MVRFRAHLLTSVLLGLVAAQVFYAAGRKGAATPIPGERWFVEATLAPVEWLRWPYRQAVRLWRGYVALVGVRQENEALRKRVAEIEAEVLRLGEEEAEAGRLRRLLGFREGTGLTGVGADVVTRMADGIASAIFVGAGYDQGVQRNDAVTSSEGMVGLVVSVATDYSKVLPVTDPRSAVGAVVQRSRVQGVLKGAGGGRCRLDHLPAEGDVQVGDVVLSSGLDALYPAGIRLGVVSRVERPTRAFFADIEVVPAVRFYQLEEVIVTRPAKVEATPATDPAPSP
ncbi:MAG: rod shape-determining protein MreC [Nitrospirae bacterium]|nr:rod shape-determining protein MreC [Nitrospirota bacterium]